MEGKDTGYIRTRWGIHRLVFVRNDGKTIIRCDDRSKAFSTPFLVLILGMMESVGLTVLREYGDVTYLVIFAALMVVMGYLFKTVPGGLVPDEDQGYVMTMAILPPGRGASDRQPSRPPPVA